MKETTTRSFGLLIAYLLPGIACFCYVAIWWQPFKSLLEKFMVSKSDIGSFLFVMLIALLLGLILNAIRWVLYEKIFLKKHSLPPAYFVTIIKDNSLLAIHTAIDENFRYHQFYGNLSLIIPFYSITLVDHVLTTKNIELQTLWYFGVILGLSLLCIALEIIFIWAANESFLRYIERGTKIMEGGLDAKRIQEKAQEESEKEVSKKKGSKKKEKK